jgi:predicted nuclease of predicted toxin-antitoxin system
MIWREQKPHYGVVRLENLPRAERVVLLEDVLEQYGQDLMAGAIIIAQRTKFRIRRF